MMHYREWDKMPKGTVVTIAGGMIPAEHVRQAGSGRGGLLAWLLASLVRPANLPFNILAFLLGRVSILGELAPFGLAFCAAAAQASPSRAPAAALAALAGMLSAGRFLEAGLYLVVMLIYVKMADRLTRQHHKLQAVPLYVFTAAVAAGGLALLWRQAPPYGFLLVAFDAALCVVLTYIFRAALPLVDGRPMGRAPGSETVMSVVVLLAAAAAGLGDVAVAGFGLRNVASSLVIMLLAFAGGPGLGAAAGVAVGLVAGLDAGSMMVGLYGIAGLMAAAFRSLGKAAVIAGFLLGGAIAVLQFSPPVQLTRALAEGAAAAAIFAAVPVEWLRLWSRGLRERDGEERSEPPPAPAAAAKLARVAEIFAGLAAALGKRAAQKGAKVQDEELARLLAAAGEKVCGPCRRRAVCWDQDYHRTCQAMLAALAAADKARLTSGTLPELLRERCERGRELAETVNAAAERNRALSFWDKKTAETRLLAAEQLKAVGTVLRDLAGEVGRGEAAATAREAAGFGRFRVTTGWASAAKEKVSGDTAAVLPLPGGRVALVLSDGMGTGSRAAGDSAATVRFLERLLTAGFAVDVAVRTVNSLLLLKLPEESFTTVDMTVIDTTAGEAEFLKVGAAPSFVKRVREVATVKSASLPVGIMQQVELEPVRWLLAAGDIIVMVSDGVVEVPGRGLERETWLANFLRRLPEGDPQELAELILRQAVELAGHCRRDDMTVVVAKIAEQPGAPP